MHLQATITTLAQGQSELLYLICNLEQDKTGRFWLTVINRVDIWKPVLSTDHGVCCRSTAGENIVPSSKVLWDPRVTVIYLFRFSCFFWVKTHTFLPLTNRCFFLFPGLTFRPSSYLNRGHQKRINVYLYKLIFVWLRCRPRPLMLHFAEKLWCLCRESDPAYLTNNARHRCLPRMCASVCLVLWLNHGKYDMWVLLMFFSPWGSVNRFIQ